MVYFFKISKDKILNFQFFKSLMLTQSGIVLITYFQIQAVSQSFQPVCVVHTWCRFHHPSGTELEPSQSPRSDVSSHTTFIIYSVIPVIESNYG